MYKIGVFGSSSEDALEDPTVVKEKIEMLGKELAAHDCVVITGACSGIPYEVAEAAHGFGAHVWGFSPAANRDEQRAMYPEQSIGLYTKLIFVPPEVVRMDIAVRKKYRNVMSTARCDAGIIVSGKWGTMHEFCSLYDYGKVIGVLTGTCGIADELLGLCKKIDKDTGAKVFFNRSPKQLVETVVQELARKNEVSQTCDRPSPAKRDGTGE